MFWYIYNEVQGRFRPDQSSRFVAVLYVYIRSLEKINYSRSKIIRAPAGLEELNHHVTQSCLHGRCGLSILYSSLIKTPSLLISLPISFVSLIVNNLHCGCDNAAINVRHYGITLNHTLNQFHFYDYLMH